MDEERNNVNEESRGLTFKDILFIIRKHWIAIICFIVACTAAGFIWSKVEPPVYSSTGTMLVSYESGSSTLTQDYTFSNYITNTYVAFIKEDAVLIEAADRISENSEIKVKPTARQLKKSLSVSADSLILKVTYRASDPDDAKNIVDAVIKAASDTADLPKVDENGDIVYKKDSAGNLTTEPEPMYRFLNGNLTKVSDARTGVKVSHTLRNTAIGFAAGVVLAIVYIVIRELSNNTFKSSEEIERILNLPVLAGIPDYHFDDEKKGGK